MKKTVAVILAGGIGARMGTEIPKQFIELAGKPLILHTVERFEKSALISDIVIVSHEDYLKDLDGYVKQNAIKKIYKIVPGGKTRQESSFNGVKSCPSGTELVLIHDAVRPFVDDEIITDTILAAREEGAAGPAVAAGDTVIIKKGDFIESIPSRKNVKKIQTPQTFHYKVILEAHKWALKNNIADSSDDCGLVLSMGKAVRVVEGSERNIKITTKEDLFLAERFIQGGWQ